MNTCKETSSVNMISLPCPPIAPLLYVAEGFSLASRKRACEPCWSQSTSRGTGKRRSRISFASARGASSSCLNASCSGWS